MSLPATVNNGVDIPPAPPFASAMLSSNCVPAQCELSDAADM